MKRTLTSTQAARTIDYQTGQILSKIHAAVGIRRDEGRTEKGKMCHLYNAEEVAEDFARYKAWLEENRSPSKEWRNKKAKPRTRDFSRGDSAEPVTVVVDEADKPSPSGARYYPAGRTGFTAGMARVSDRLHGERL